MTLRDRLMDLSNSQDAYGYEHPTREHVALAAARLALEDAAQACEAQANHALSAQKGDPSHAVNVQLRMMALLPNDCAAAIRALRDGIA